MSNGVKKNRLTPHQYDEVSLVDLGANQDSHVLIYKRQDRGELRGGAPRVPDKPGNFKFKTLTQDPKKTLDAKVKGVKTVSGSSGKKGRKKGTTQRAKNWQENRHPRNKKGSGDASGEFATTSADSKRKYGKNGTTKAKLESGKTRKTKTAPKGGTKVHTTVKGDTLWDLAQKYLGDGRRWKEIGRLNGITTEAQARKLQIGVSLKLPGGGTSSAKKTSAKKTAKKTKTETSRVTRLVMEPGGRIHRETVTRKKTNPVPSNPSAHPKRTWKPPVKKTPPVKRNLVKKNDLLMSWIDPNKEAH